MECPRGGVCKSAESILTSLKHAREWYEKAEESQLPIRVDKQIGAGGRIRAVISDRHGNVLERRG